MLSFESFADENMGRLLAPGVRMSDCLTNSTSLIRVMGIEIESFSRDLPKCELWDTDDVREFLQFGSKIAVFDDPKTHSVLGYVMYFKAQRHRVEIQRVAVVPSARRRGIGTALVNWCVQEALRTDADSVICDVFENCVAMQLLLKSVGFIYDEKVNEDYPQIEGTDMYRFVLETDTMCLFGNQDENDHRRMEI